jgi:hypothetical protein
MKMPHEVAYSLVEAILASQSKQERLFEFSITKAILLQLQSGNQSSDAEMDDEIIELDDPPTSPSKSSKRSPRISKTKSTQVLIDFSPPVAGAASGMTQTSVIAPIAIVSATVASSTLHSPASISLPSVTIATASTILQTTPTLTLAAIQPVDNPSVTSNLTHPLSPDILATGTAAPPTKKVTAPAKKATPVKGKSKATAALKGAKRKIDDTDSAVNRASMLKKQKTLNTAFSPRRPSAR